MRLFEALVKHGGQPAILDANGASISHRDLVEISDAGVNGIGTRQLVFASAAILSLQSLGMWVWCDKTMYA